MGVPAIWRKTDCYLGRYAPHPRRGIVLPYKYRQYHVHVLGQFGLGKSKFLEHLLRQDILEDQGLCLIDPHGSLYQAIVRWCVDRRMFERRKIHLLDLSQPDVICGFNPLHLGAFSEDEFAAAVNAMVKACAQVWGGEDMARTPRLQRVLRILFHALAERELTLAESLHLLNPVREERDYLIQTRDPVVADDWHYLSNLQPHTYAEQVESARNRLGSFLHNPAVRATVGQQARVLDLERIMDDGEVLLVNLNSPDPEAARVVGSLMVSDFYVRARRRTPDVSRPFYLYLDEATQFFNSDIEGIVTELRKFGLWLIASHQNLGQLERAGDSVYSSVMQIPNRIAFGGLPMDDLEYLTRWMFLGEIDYQKAKEKMYRPVVVDYVLERLQSASSTAGHSSASGTTSSRGTTETVNDEGEVISTSESSIMATMDGETESASETEGWSESYRPVLERLPTDLYSAEEQLIQFQVKLRDQKQRHCYAKLFGAPPVQVKVPWIDAPTIDAGYVSKQHAEQLSAGMFSRSRGEAVKSIDQRHERLLRESREAKKPPEEGSYEG